MSGACCVCDVGDKDKYADRANMFKVGLMESCCEKPGCCLYGYFCAPCAAITMRRRVLQYDMTKYSCCQGYFANACCKEGCGSDNPTFCLCLEAFCCLSCSMAGSRMTIQDTYQLRSDPCDQRLICCQQICVLASCICNVAGLFCEEAACLGDIMGCASDCMFMSIMGCMTSQIQTEIDHQQHLVPLEQRTVIFTEPSGIVYQQSAPYPNQQDQQYQQYQQNQQNQQKQPNAPYPNQQYPQNPPHMFTSEPQGQPPSYAAGPPGYGK